MLSAQEARGLSNHYKGFNVDVKIKEVIQKGWTSMFISKNDITAEKIEALKEVGFIIKEENEYEYLIKW